jgi:hypothetical protein
VWQQPSDSRGPSQPLRHPLETLQVHACACARSPRGFRPRKQTKADHSLHSRSWRARHSPPPHTNVIPHTWPAEMSRITTSAAGGAGGTGFGLNTANRCGACEGSSTARMHETRGDRGWVNAPACLAHAHAQAHARALVARAHAHTRYVSATQSQPPLEDGCRLRLALTSGPCRATQLHKAASLTT